MCVGDCFTFVYDYFKNMIVHNVGLNLLHFVFLLDVVVPLRLPRNDLLCFALHASRCVALHCVALRCVPVSPCGGISQPNFAAESASHGHGGGNNQSACDRISQPASQPVIAT